MGRNDAIAYVSRDLDRKPIRYIQKETASLQLSIARNCFCDPQLVPPTGHAEIANPIGAMIFSTGFHIPLGI